MVTLASFWNYFDTVSDILYLLHTIFHSPLYLRLSRIVNKILLLHYLVGLLQKHDPECNEVSCMMKASRGVTPAPMSRWGHCLTLPLVTRCKVGTQQIFVQYIQPAHCACARHRDEIGWLTRVMDSTDKTNQVDQQAAWQEGAGPIHGLLKQFVCN